MIKWNKVTWYSKFGAIIFFLLILPVLTFYIGIQFEKTKSEYRSFLIPTVSTKVTTMGRNAEEVNAASSYSVVFPLDFVSRNDLTPVQKVDKGSYMDVCMLANNPYYDPKDKVFCYVGSEKSDGFVGAAFVVNATSSITQEDCSKPKFESSDTQTSISINGSTFHKNKYSSAGLGHYLSIDSYRTYHNKICYTLDLKVESDRGMAEKGLSANFSGMMFKKLEAILATFRFVD